MAYRGQDGLTAIRFELEDLKENGGALTKDDAIEYRLSALEQAVFSLSQIVVDQNKMAVSRLDRDASKYMEIGSDIIESVKLIRDLSTATTTETLS